MNHLPNYLLLTLLMSNATDSPDGKPSNNCNRSGSVGYLTTYRVCNNVTAGRGHPLTNNQAISYCLGRKTRHPYFGVQL